MKIIWFCIPAHGHTNPTLGLVKALTDTISPAPRPFQINIILSVLPFVL